MRWLLLALLLVLGVLQYWLWFAEGSLAEQRRLERQVEEQTGINEQLQQRNAVLEREVLELQNGNEGVEQRAREQLGLIREGEMFYQVVEDLPPGSAQPAGGDAALPAQVPADAAVAEEAAVAPTTEDTQ